MNESITQRVCRAREQFREAKPKNNIDRSKQLEDAVGNLLDAKGLRYMRVDNYRCFKCGQVQNTKAKGHPDFEIYYPHFYVECKTGTGKLSKDQREIIKLIERSGLTCLVLRDNIDNLIELIDVLLPHNKKPAIWRDEHNNLPHTKRKFKRRVMG